MSCRHNLFAQVNAYPSDFSNTNVQDLLTANDAIINNLTFNTATGTVLVDEKVNDLKVLTSFTGVNDNFMNNANVYGSFTGLQANIVTLNSTDNFLTNVNLTSLTGTNSLFTNSVTNLLKVNSQMTGNTASFTNVASTSFTGNSMYLPSVKYNSILATFNTFQIQSMYTGAIQILPPPGNNFAYYIDSCMGNIMNSTGFQGGGNIAIQYSTGNKAQGTNATNNISTFNTAFLTTQGNQTVFCVGVNNPVPTASSSYVNQPISISNATAPFLGGTGCTLNVILDYRLIPMS